MTLVLTIPNDICANDMCSTSDYIICNDIFENSIDCIDTSSNHISSNGILLKHPFIFRMENGYVGYWIIYQVSM